MTMPRVEIGGIVKLAIHRMEVPETFDANAGWRHAFHRTRFTFTNGSSTELEVVIYSKKALIIEGE